MSTEEKFRDSNEHTGMLEQVRNPLTFQCDTSSPWLMGYLFSAMKLSLTFSVVPSPLHSMDFFLLFFIPL